MSENETTSVSNWKMIRDHEAERQGALGKSHFQFSELKGLKIWTASDILPKDLYMKLHPV